MSKVIAVTNQKGGRKDHHGDQSGRRARPRRPQSAARRLRRARQRTSGVGKRAARPGGTIYEAITGTNVDVHDFILPTSTERLFIIPATRDLSGAEIELISCRRP
jgi:cellulose biosynthesis protein BcsQ